MSDGATRPMDARALTFLERMGAKVALIDSRTTAWLTPCRRRHHPLQPAAARIAVMRRCGNQIAEARQHPLTMRRHVLEAFPTNLK